MSLFVSTHYDRLCLNGQDQNRGSDHFPVTKLVLPRTGCAMLLSEIRLEQDSKLAYGIADYGYGSIHVGYIDLEAVFAMSDPMFGERVKPDLNFEGKHPLSVYLFAAKMQGYITDEEHHLQTALRWHNPEQLSEQQQERPTRLLEIPKPS